jgi:hypothetical protein
MNDRRNQAERIKVLLTPDEHAPAAARRALRRLPLGELRDDVLLLTSELVTSAVMDGAGVPIELEAECRGDGARVAVRNRGGGRFARPAGHRLRILEAATDGWGVDDGPPGVWFELS